MHRVVGRQLSTYVKQELDFSNAATAYRRKSFSELVRALAILKAFSYDRVVDNSLWLMNVGQRFLGPRLFSAVVRPTIYKQFIGGATVEEMQESVAALKEAGVRPMIACSMEEEDEHTAGTDIVYDNNTATILKCLDMSTQLNSVAPMMQLKMTGIVPADLVVRLGEFFRACPTPESLVEVYANALSRGCLRQDEERLLVIKDDHLSIQLALERLRQIGEKSKEVGVKILVDAEYTHMNAGINLLALTLMAAFNESEPHVWNTYQCYLKNATQTLQHDITVAKNLGVAFGVKLVRGAYMDSERRRARAMKYEDPVCDSYDSTNKSYNKSMSFLIEKVKNTEQQLRFIIASHNEDSIRAALKRMRELDMPADHPSVNFGQLLGMYDQITYPLAEQGYNVYKSIPYGPMDDVLPYLARRASENRAVLRGPLKERQMLAKEIRYRLKLSLPVK
ncbi:hydroxyproline dehydrogenase-like [Ornithodoros turicata]|uniref:hydroxyproline dehydrogenase-like n=1 Tax=Ornithodoros turicata TaxID=34597 RepID=UPI003139E1B4